MTRSGLRGKTVRAGGSREVALCVHPGVIVFDLPDDSGPIQPLSSFVLADVVVIDGHSQAGATPNSLPFNETNAVIKVAVDGSNLPDGNHLLAIDADDVLIRGLAIYDSASIGVLYSTGSRGVMRGNFIGVREDGTTDDGNGSHDEEWEITLPKGLNNGDIVTATATNDTTAARPSSPNASR